MMMPSLFTENLFDDFLMILMKILWKEKSIVWKTMQET